MTRLWDIGRWIAALGVSAGPLMLAGHMPRSVPHHRSAADPVGLTLIDDAHGRAIVTSLMSAGPAERGGLRVGDEIDGIDGRARVGVGAVRRSLRRPTDCRTTVDLRRGGRPLVATIDRCG